MSHDSGGRLFMAMVALCFLLISRHQWSADIRDSDDDVTYLSYAMSLGMDADLDFENELKCCQNMALNGRVPGGFYGAGMLAAPFVGLFSLADRATNHPVISDRHQYLHSWSYFGFSFAVHAYFLSAVFLLWRTARRLDADAGLPMVFLLAAGSGVYYYVFGRPRMAHGFEFFALALLLYGSVRAAKASGHGGELWKANGISASGVALTLAVRFSDINALLLPLIVWMMLALSGRSGEFSLRRWVAFISSYALLLVGALSFLGLMNIAVYDAAFLSSRVVYGASTQLTSLEAGNEGVIRFVAAWVKMAGSLPTVIFGAEFGLLYTDPVAVVGLVLGFWLVLANGQRHNLAVSSALGLLILAYALFSLTIVLIWKSPGMSFGYRSLFPLFPLGFSGWWLWRAQANVRARQAIQAVLVALCLLSLTGQALFTKTPRLGYEKGVTSLGQDGQTARHFMTNLMQDILTTEPWSVAFKDGSYGYVAKMYLSKAYLRWLAQRLHGEQIEPPARQHPPIDGLYLAILAALWVAWTAVLLRLRKSEENRV